MPRSATSSSAGNAAVYASGAEFALPWMIDITFMRVQEFKKLFSKPELETLVHAHRRVQPDGPWFEKKRIIGRIEAYVEQEGPASFSTSMISSLLHKLRRREDIEAVTLSVWARSYWYLREQQDMDIDAYTA